MKSILFLLLFFIANIVNAGEVVIVYFSATWCGPCKVFEKNFLEKDIDNLIKSGKIDVSKVDIDVSPEITQEYRVDSVPTVVAVKRNGGKTREIKRFSGALPKDKFMLFLKEIIDGKD